MGCSCPHCGANEQRARAIALSRVVGRAKTSRLNEALFALARHVLATLQPMADARRALTGLVAEADRG